MKILLLLFPLLLFAQDMTNNHFMKKSFFWNGPVTSDPNDPNLLFAITPGGMRFMSRDSIFFFGFNLEDNLIAFDKGKSRYKLWDGADWSEAIFIEKWADGATYRSGDIVYVDEKSSDLFVNKSPGIGSSNINIQDWFRLARPSLGTGLYTGGQVTTGSLPYRVDITAGEGAIVNTYDQPLRVFNDIDFASVTDFEFGAVEDGVSLYTVGIDVNGQAVSWPNIPSNEQVLDNIVLDLVEIDPSGNVLAIYDFNWWGRDTNNQLNNLVRFLGTFRTGTAGASGAGIPSGNANGTGIDFSPGQVHCWGCNNTDQHRLDNLRIFNGLVDATQTYYDVDSVEGVPTKITDTSSYDTGSGIGTISNNAYGYSVLYLSYGGQVQIQYGVMNESSGSIEQAETDACKQATVKNPALINSFPVGMFVYKKGVSTIDAESIFAASNKFGELCASGGGGGGGGGFTGPANSTADNIMTFLDSSGDIGKDSGVAITAVTGSVTNHDDVTDAGSGEIITDAERAALHPDPGVTGDVSGPNGATGNNFAAFDGSTGKLIKDSGISMDNAVVSNLAGTRMVSCSFDSSGNKMDDTSLCGWVVLQNRPETGRWNYTMNGWAGTPTCVISSYYDGDRWCGGDPKGGAWTSTRIAANCFEDASGTARRDIPHKIVCHGRKL